MDTFFENPKTTLLILWKDYCFKMNLSCTAQYFQSMILLFSRDKTIVYSLVSSLNFWYNLFSLHLSFIFLSSSQRKIPYLWTVVKKSKVDKLAPAPDKNAQLRNPASMASFLYSSYRVGTRWLGGQLTGAFSPLYYTW